MASTEIRPSILGEVKEIARLAVPVVGTQLAFMALNVTDVVMAGRLGATDLAAVAVGNSILMPFYITCMGVLMSVNPVVGHLYGAGRHKEIGAKLHQALWLGMVLAVPVMAFLFNVEPLLGLMGIPSEIIEKSAGYLYADAWGIPFAFAFMCIRFFNDGLSLVKPTMVVLMFAVPLNVLGNYIFMYGHFGLPAMGAVGTGYATALDMAFLCFALGSWTVIQLGKQYQLTRFHLPVWADLKELVSIGIPNGVSLALEISMFSLIAIFIATLGETMVGAHQIALNISSVAFMIPLGISLALGIRIGHAAGRADMDAVWHMGKSGLLLTAVVQLVTASGMAIFADTLVGWYTKEAAVAELAVKLIYFAAIFQLSDGLQTVSLGALRGLKDTRIPMIANTFAYWVVGLPVGYWLGMKRGMGPSGFWIGMLFGLTMAAVAHLIRFILLLRARRSQ